MCAALLPYVMEVNVRALERRHPAKLVRYSEVARLLTGRPYATVTDGVKWVAAGDIPALVEKAAQASSMKGNPIVLTGEELREIVSCAL